ncbi:MAG TPA: hypothetical protein VKU00_21035, partial [Chthonomonadaceae bacterium]|nr:hypothetical protein [Chthonomonadaceae bacterium]
NKLPNVEAKQYLISNLAALDHPRTLDILYLGATDPSVPVQNRALQYLENFGFQSFVEDYNAYLQWHEKNLNKPVEEVIRDGMQDAVERLNKTDDMGRLTLLNLLVRTNFSPYTRLSRLRRQAALDTGLSEAVLRWANQPNLAWLSFQIIRNIRPSEAFLRKSVLPLTDKKVDAALRYQALNTLAAPENVWAEDMLLKMLVEEYPDPSTDMIGSVLAQIGDPHCIPTLISMMEADNSQEGIRALGNMLAQLTGVNNNVGHDAAWWRTWWTKNSGRFSPEVRALTFPKVALRPRPAPQPFFNGIAEQPSKPELHQIANDPKRAYWLITPFGMNNGVRLVAREGGLRFQVLAADPDSPARVKTQAVVVGAPAPPEAKTLPGLLVVMTSDGNGADAAGFWQDVAHKAFADKYFIAVAVAPKWSLDQSMTWITRSTLKQVKDAKFSDETLAADIVKDVSAAYKINPDHVFLHGVGESGPVAYSASLEETTPFKGFYILSSPFKTVQLPPLARAKGRRYYIQNTQDDKAAPYWMASAASKLLGEQGATTRLDTHSGYMGSKQDQAMWDQFKAILTWLETGK